MSPIAELKMSFHLSSIASQLDADRSDCDL